MKSDRIAKFKDLFTARQWQRALLLVMVSGALAACSNHEQALGTAQHPLTLELIPSVDRQVLEKNGETLRQYLEKSTPYKFKVIVPNSFEKVVDNFGDQQADIAVINSFGYILARERYQVEARLTVLRYGLATYQSQIIVRAQSPIKKISDLKGQRVAFVDKVSASGYLLPLRMLQSQKIQPKEEVFAGEHDAVVEMVYKGSVDAGATFYAPKEDEQIQDARRLVLKKYPDVEKKLRIIEVSEPIPNDPLVFRHDLPEVMKEKITTSLLAFVGTPEGKEIFEKMYGVTGLKKATDADYDTVREMLRELGKQPADLMKNKETK